MKRVEAVNDICCRLIREICDGDMTQTDELAKALRKKFTVGDMEKCAAILTAQGREW